MRIRQARDGLVEASGPRDDVFALAALLGLDVDRLTIAVVGGNAVACWAAGEEAK
jgi:hypothetical protein